ncbi:GNAT family N-acetyltransferase [Actinomadura physcomitrii]|nr:GNAT family N-acetyltransferase [Actinomadura physcomitrii]
MAHAIRTATTADAAAIARLHLSSYRAAYRGLLPDGFLAAYDPAERERRWLQRLRDPDRTWRQGLGCALHSHALDALTVRGFRSATLWVLDGNQRACAFYEATGWTPTRETRHRRESTP